MAGEYFKIYNTPFIFLPNHIYYSPIRRYMTNAVQKQCLNKLRNRLTTYYSVTVMNFKEDEMGEECRRHVGDEKPLAGNCEGKRPTVRSGRKWKDILKLYF
jgi:hypothetical protein